MNKNKTKQKNTKHVRLFRKYTKKDYLTKSQIKKLMKHEFKLVYNKHIINSFMGIWGTTRGDRRVITENTFVTKLFEQPDGFFRDIIL